MTGGNPHYRRGHAAELRAKARLEEQGWTVFRTAGSKTPCDLIAVRRVPVESSARALFPDLPRLEQTVLLFVQVKNGQRPMPRRERDAFKDFALAHGARPLLIERGNKWSWLDSVGGVVGEAA